MNIDGGRTVLIVDDDRDFTESVGSFLEAHGFRVIRAHDGREGLKRALVDRPDLILMDVMMSERTEGFFAVQQMRHEPALDTVPIFVVSSLYHDVPDFRIEPDMGWMAHDAFFPKPVDMDRLLSEIEAHVPAASTAGRAPAGEDVP